MTELTRLIAKYITRDTHKGSVNRIRHLMEVDLEALIDKRMQEARQEEWDYLKGSGDALTQVGEKDAGTIVRAAVMVRETMYKDRLSAKHSSKEDE